MFTSYVKGVFVITCPHFLDGIMDGLIDTRQTIDLWLLENLEAIWSERVTGSLDRTCYLILVVLVSIISGMQQLVI